MSNCLLRSDARSRWLWEYMDLFAHAFTHRKRNMEAENRATYGPPMLTTVLEDYCMEQPNYVRYSLPEVAEGKSVVHLGEEI